MPATRLERIWLLGGLVVAFFVVALGYLFFISPQRSETSDINSQASMTQQANFTLRARINGLQQQSKSLATYQAQLTQARLALPNTSGLPDFLRTLQSIGNATLANVSSVTVGPPTDVTTVSGGAPAASGAAAAPAGGASAGPRIYALPITASVSGTASRLDQFLTQLQSVQPRAVLISQLTEGFGGAGGATSLQLTMQAFVAPGSAAEQAQLSAASGS